MNFIKSKTYIVEITTKYHFVGTYEDMRLEKIRLMDDMPHTFPGGVNWKIKVTEKKKAQN